jgi:hypothetical protein
MQLSFWRKCRTAFRWCRISLWLVVLAAACALLWLNRVGLPDFLKTRLVAELRSRGVELEFSRMRLNLVRGIVADNVRIGHAQTPDSPALSLAEVQLQLDFRAMLHLRLQADGLVLRQGQLVWPLTSTNALTLDHIQTELRFQKNDTWALENFKADFAGTTIVLSGEVTHAMEIRNWEMFRGQKTAGRAEVQAQLQMFSDTFNQIHLAGAPQLILVVDGDARDLHSFTVRLDAIAPAAQTPWFSARDIEIEAKLTAPVDAPTNCDAAWGFWTNARPYQLECSVQAAELRTEKLKLDSVAFDGLWSAPELVITNLSVTLGGGRLDAVVGLDVATRKLVFTNASSFDIQAVAGLLTDKAREQLAKVSWKQPPRLRAAGSLVLPAWTNRPPDWAGAVWPSVRLNGELALTNITVPGAAINSASTHFSYSNLVWRLPDLQVVQGKTWLVVDGREDDATKNYRCRIWGTFDPEAMRPFLSENVRRSELDQMAFTQPLGLDVTVNGRLPDWDSIGVNGQITLTNYVIRGQAVDGIASAVAYTNRVLEFIKPHLRTGTQTMTADRVALDFRNRLILFTNGFSTADPESMARAIGPKTGEFMEAYHFLSPPTARVNGHIPLRAMHGPAEMTNVDLRFDIVQGAPFHWLKLNTPRIEGTVHWLGSKLILTNLTALVYGGTGNGFALFDFLAPHAGADYGFALNVTNINLHELVADVGSPTNKLEGLLSGHLVVTNASSEDLQSWNGFGAARLHDGLIWDIPVFGILSPVLNTFSPGLGNSRATDASARFIITNGVIYTGSLEIQSSMTRLQYVGTVGLNQNVNARVTAQLLRDTWVFGPLISTVLFPVSKLFEYQVTGTLKNPRTEPLYVPKLLLMPLHPIRSLQEMLPGGSAVPAGD